MSGVPSSITDGRAYGFPSCSPTYKLALKRKRVISLLLSPSGDYVFIHICMCVFQRPVFQSWISANPGLKFNLLFQFVYFCTSVYFKTSEK